MFAGLPPNRAPVWGTMNAGQMLDHCHAFHRLCLGEIRPGRGVRLAARLLGPFMLRQLLAKSPKNAPKNLRTLSEIRADRSPEDFAAAKERLLASIEALETLEDDHPHPLYGPMCGDDVRAIARHHLAHHAHQFDLW